jgi:hypothetical protein
MAKGLQIAEPPRRRSEAAQDSPEGPNEGRGEKFTQVAEAEKVQFNKRVTRGVADGYEMLAIRTRKKVPELLAEALELLEERYGKV